MVDWGKLTGQKRTDAKWAIDKDKQEQADRTTLTRDAVTQISAINSKDPCLHLKAKAVWKHDFPKEGYFRYPVVEISYKVKEGPGFFAKTSKSGLLILDCSFGEIAVMQSKSGAYDNGTFANSKHFRENFDRWLAWYLFSEPYP